jgi:hypothetical protein
MPRVIRRPFKLAIKSSPSPASSRTPLNPQLPRGKNYNEALWTSVYVLGKNFKQFPSVVNLGCPKQFQFSLPFSISTMLGLPHMEFRNL